MNFKNPVIRGMYPDPSMCVGPNGKYYMVCSSFQYFPGVPLFESDDLINWKKIGSCLTRPTQLLIEKNVTNTGIYAPTIRCYKNRFYMVVTNVENIGNFYVYTDDIYGEWSDPVIVDQDGIDPSLFFDSDGKVYFISNGNDESGRGYIQMSQIDIETGKKLSENVPLWYGTGGRYIEAPHLYKFGEYYYLLDAEGGTEYGHMVNYARSKSITGPYEPCPFNPVLTNRDLGGYVLQGAGHGDILEATDGTWWFCHLAFRQTDKYMTFHHLGRETCMECVVWDEDGWFHIGTNKTALLEVECPPSFDNHKVANQSENYSKTFTNLTEKLDWCYLCNPLRENYYLRQDFFELTAGLKTLDDNYGSPTFIGIRQCEFTEEIKVLVKMVNYFEQAEKYPQTGITIYMDYAHHYDLCLEKRGEQMFAVLRLRIGPAVSVLGEVEISRKKLFEGSVHFKIVANKFGYDFYADQVHLGFADSKYLSSEVAGGFTGVFIGLFAQNGAVGNFSQFSDNH